MLLPIGVREGQAEAVNVFHSFGDICLLLTQLDLQPMCLLTALCVPYPSGHLRMDVPQTPGEMQYIQNGMGYLPL